PLLLGVDHLLAVLAPKLTGRLAWLGERWAAPPQRDILPELVRGAILAVGFMLAWMPIWLPLVIDSEGFGGFPHRVSDEVGPGFATLGRWYASGELLDWIDRGKLGFRLMLLTFSLPVIVLLARAPFYRWLWAPGFFFALLLGIGP